MTNVIDLTPIIRRKKSEANLEAAYKNLDNLEAQIEVKQEEVFMFGHSGDYIELMLLQKIHFDMMTSLRANKSPIKVKEYEVL